MKITNFLILTLFLISTSANATKGMVNLKSKYSVEKTTRDFVNVLKSRGITVFTVIDHLKNAKSVGLNIRQSKVIIFGNPKIGTKLIQCKSESAIDLPMKALIWQNPNFQTIFSYNNMTHIMARHNLACSQKVLSKIDEILDDIARETLE